MQVKALDTGSDTSLEVRLEPLTNILKNKRVLVLSGAGISTESGIPDYRGPDRKRPAKPMRYQEFVSADFGRQRYWSRSMIGWATMGDAKPNQGHKAIAAMEASGNIFGVLTQNVDGLHQAAGSKSVLELHGSLACLLYTSPSPRDATLSRMPSSA